MAWDTADYFRKHKKIVFAVLTVIAMFVFIIGDPLSSRGFGDNPNQKRSRGWFTDDDSQLVAVVEGQKIFPEDLNEMAMTRTVVLAFIGGVEVRGRAVVFGQLGFTPQEMLELDRLMQIMQQYGQLAGQILNQLPEPRRKLLERYFAARNSQFDLWQLSTMSRDSLSMDYYQNWQQMQDPTTERPLGTFERGTGREFTAPETLIDNLYWKKQADIMGIVLTPAQIKEDLLRCGRDRLTEVELNEVMRAVRQRTQSTMTLDEMYKEIGHELRAAIARTVLLGDQDNKLAQLTPLDLWEGYVQLKTQLDVGILPLAASDNQFISQAPSPKPEELKAYFHKYRDKLPDPNSDTPGFKVPKLHKISYLYANLRETQETRKHYESFVQLSLALNPLYFHLSLLQEYGQQSLRYTSNESIWDFTLGDAANRQEVRLHPFAAQPVDPMLGAQTLCGAALQMLQPGAGHWAVLATRHPSFRLLSPKEQAVMQAAQALALANAAALHWTGLLTAFPEKRIIQSTIIKPFDEVHDQLKYDFIEEQCRQELQRDLKHVEAVLTEYGKRYTEKRLKWRNVRRTTNVPFDPPFYDEEKKVTLDEYLMQFAQKRGLQYAVSQEARTQDDLVKESLESSIGTLKNLFKSQYALMPQEQIDQQIASRLVEADRAFEWREIRPGYDLQWKELGMYWQSERTEERLPSFEEAEPKVRIAWMQEQARPFAEEAAKRAAAEVKKQPDGIRLLIDRPGFKDHQTLARFQLSTNLATASAITYEIAPIPVIEHPMPDLISEAFKTLQQPGDSLVVWNQPKTHCYLIVLRERKEPRPDDLRAREDFDFKVIVPDQTRQIQVQMGQMGQLPFNSFVLREKLAREQKNWLEFLKKHTQFNEEVAKKLSDRI